MAHDGIMTGILIPEGGDPRHVEFETLGRDSVDEALARLVGGWFDTWPGVIPGVDLWINDDGASKFGPNRAIYATGTRRASAGGEPYAILHGPIVALGFDPDTCESVSLTDGQARAVIEYFTETSPAGSGLVESMRLGPGVPPFPDDRADTVPPCTRGGCDMAKMRSTTGYLDAMLMESALLARTCVPRTACGTTSPRPLPCRMARRPRFSTRRLRPPREAWSVPCPVVVGRGLLDGEGRDAGRVVSRRRLQAGACPASRRSPWLRPPRAGAQSRPGSGRGGRGGAGEPVALLPLVARGFAVRPGVEGVARVAGACRVPPPLFFVWPGFQCRRRAGVASSIPSVSMSLTASSYPSFHPSM